MLNGSREADRLPGMETAASTARKTRLYVSQLPASGVLMPKILSISSHVVRGHVGNAAAVPALQALGHETWSAPTVILSNHPAHGSTAGTTIEADVLDAILSKIAEFGWHRELAAISTGYFRTIRQVEVTARHIAEARVANPQLQVLVDPVIGDDPNGLYVPQPVADAIRDHLLPLADTITPNRFELSWLARREVRDLPALYASAQMLGVAETIVTSFPRDENTISNVLITSDHRLSADVIRRPRVPNGTGDLLASLLLGHRLNGYNLADSLARAVAGIDLILDRTGTRNELDLTGGLSALETVEPAILTPA